MKYKAYGWWNKQRDAGWGNLHDKGASFESIARDCRYSAEQVRQAVKLHKERLVEEYKADADDLISGGYI